MALEFDYCVVAGLLDFLFLRPTAEGFLLTDTAAVCTSKAASEV